MEDTQPLFLLIEEEEEEEDVPVAEETTAPDSSTEEQTTTEETNVETTETESEDAKTVPYSRFREVNERAKRVDELEKKLADIEARATNQDAANPQAEQVKQQLKALGFVSQDEVQAQLRQQQEDARVEQTLAKLESTYSGKDGRPQFKRTDVLEYALEHGIPSPELAYKAMHEQALLDWHIKTALTKTGSIKTEGSDGSGSQQVGTTDEDLKTAIAKGDKSALHTFLKRLSS